jgi:hypothetical protein
MSKREVETNSEGKREKKKRGKVHQLNYNCSNITIPKDCEILYSQLCVHVESFKSFISHIEKMEWIKEVKFDMNYSVLEDWLEKFPNLRVIRETLNLLRPDESKKLLFVKNHLSKNDRWREVQLDQYKIILSMTFRKAFKKGFQAWKMIFLNTLYAFQFDSIRDNFQIFEEIILRNETQRILVRCFPKNDFLWLYWIFRNHLFIPREIIYQIFKKSIWLFLPVKGFNEMILIDTPFPLFRFAKACK